MREHETRRLKLAAVFVASISLEISAGAAADEGGNSPFAAARYDEAAQVVRFTPFAAVDWEQVVRRRFQQFDIDWPSPKDMDYLRERIWEISGGAELTVRAPLDLDVGLGTYSLIAAEGIVPIELARLEAIVRFEFDQATPPQLVGRHHFGYAVSQRLRSGGGGGVVYWSSRRQRPVQIAHATATLRAQDGRVFLDYTDERSKASVAFPKPWHGAVLASYGLEVEGGRYLFVAWPPDIDMMEAGCLHSYSLYAVRETLEEVSASTYDCDV